MPWDEMNNWLINDKLKMNLYRLLEVYETANSVDVKVLKETAKKLYPELYTDSEPKIIVHEGHGRAFDHNGECKTPAYIICGDKLSMLGIMDDGTAYLF